ncbi:flagellar basal body rod modification protein [compost metagenome]
MPLAASGPGPLAFAIDPLKLGLKPGKYEIRVDSSSGEAFDVLVKGKVGNVRKDGGEPVLDVAGVGRVPFSHISEFS